MRKLIGDRKIYMMLLRIAFPIMIQNGITNFVALLDNIMIGAVGTDQMSGVSIINQLIFVFNLCIFGAISGAGIFSAQFYGQGNHEGVKHSFRFKLVISTVITLIGLVVFILFGGRLASFYMHEGGDTGNIEATMGYSMDYLKIMLIGLFPFAVEQCYSGTLRETNETVVPMKAGIVAVCINLILNYILIYGKLGAPELGVEGAAIATVIARIAECSIIIIWTHTHKERNKFIIGAYRHFTIPISLVKSIIVKGTPLLMNECLWAAGMAMLTQSYSVRGLSVVAALNIASTIGNLFNIMFIAIGSAVAIIVGQYLGAGKFDDAMDTAVKIIFATFIGNVIIGCVLFILASLFPMIYNTSDEVRNLATDFIRVIACMMPIQAVLHATYFTIRSGGKTFITFLFDSTYVWVVSIPLAFVLSRYTLLGIVVVYLICQMADLIKLAIGMIMLKKGIWLSNIVTEL